jgi:hypothetical protein
MMADSNSDKMWEIEDKIKSIFGRESLQKEVKGLKTAVDLNTTKIN